MNIPEETASTLSQQSEKDPGNEIETVTPNENVHPLPEKKGEDKEDDKSE